VIVEQIVVQTGAAVREEEVEEAARDVLVEAGSVWVECSFDCVIQRAKYVIILKE
jgi:hypothetical protein